MSWWLRMYPRAWRERYGEELEELIAAEPKSVRLWLDLIAGAIDARANPQWTPLTEPEGGHKAMGTFLTSCSRSEYSREANKKSALLMLGTSLGLATAYIGLTKVVGDNVFTNALIYAAFNIAFLVSSWPTFLSNYRPTVRWTLLVLGVAASYAFMLAVALLADRF